MTDSNRHIGPRGPTAESPGSAGSEGDTVCPPPSAEASEGSVSYEKRAVAAVEAVRQMEAHLEKSASTGARRA